ARDQQAQRDPCLRANQRAGFDPQNAAHHVLQQNAGGHDQAADKAAAGQIVSTQQEIQGNQGGDRQQQAHQHGGDVHQAFGQRRFGVGVSGGRLLQDAAQAR